MAPVATTPKGVNPLGCKWVFVRKRDKFGTIFWYKAQFVAQGFIQRLGIEYEETYSPVMDSITLRYFLNLAVGNKVDGCSYRVHIWQFGY